MNKITSISSLEHDFLVNVFDKTKDIKSNWTNLEQIGLGKTICLIFWEPSTRTKLSFEHAAKKLGFTVLDFSPDQSSIMKGESLEDTLKTLVALKVDGFVIRHPEDQVSKKIANLLPDNVFYINAGDGNHAHPTQAMLDIFTMGEIENDLTKLKITILGDVNHSRVIPSQLALLNKLSCHDVSFMGPKSMISEKFRPLIEDSSENCLTDRNILFVLRIQKERFKENDAVDEIDFVKKFQVNQEFLDRTGFKGHIMHPGPMNIGAEITADVANSKNSVILSQVENGLYLRAALLSLIS
ncbi:MAG: aspartate carbamoyltransferase catalytic subunit [Gammaproteobacteria bacterium]|nr:aspartate carbamoyltransferase catalytic subunit [Gammaproteobacteria bacterium]